MYILEVLYTVQRCIERAFAPLGESEKKRVTYFCFYLHSA